MKSDYIKNGKRVGRKGLNIDNELIKRLYLEENKTMKDIGTRLGISHWTVLSRLKKMGIKKNIRHKITKPEVFSIFTPESCYWAGFIAADGCMRTNNCVDLELKREDENHLTNLCVFVGRDNKLWFREKKIDNKIYKAAVLSINSKQIKQSLQSNFNITSRKSNTLEPPRNIPSEYIHHFVRGFIDGDGSIGWHKHNNKPRLSICCGSKKFLGWLVDNIRDNASIGNPKINKIKDKKLYTIEFMGVQVYNILGWIYNSSAKNTRLERKYESYKSLIA